MDKEAKQNWLKALRSGEYQQAREKLRSVKGFCCLGVLCDVLIKQGNAPGEIAWHPYKGEWELQYKRYSDDDDVTHILGSLPAPVVEALDVSDVGDIELPRGLELRDGSRYLSLAGLNDTGFTFKQIADLIDYFF